MKRSNFNLSNYKLFTGKMGKLIPIGFQEVIPGDSFRVQTQALIRMSPMLAPIMHPIKVRIHHWYVPYRILYDKWEEFIVNPESKLSVPKVNKFKIDKGTLFDYFGLYSTPKEFRDVTHSINAFPLMAYWAIWNEFYRDQILQQEVTYSISGSGQVSGIKYADPAEIAWNKDRFTSARPFTQMGEQVFVPVYDEVGSYEWTYKEFSLTLKDSNNNIPVRLTNDCSKTSDRIAYYLDSYTQVYNFLNTRRSDILALSPGSTLRINISSLTTSCNRNKLTWLEISCVLERQATGSSQPTFNTFSYSSNFKVFSSVEFGRNGGYSDPVSSQNLTSIVTYSFGSKRQGGSMNIRDLRLSAALQRFKENRAKWGSRYIEYLNYLGVRSSDQRLQLPEYLGGGSQLLQTSEVLQTAPSDSDGVVGSLKGHGIGAVKSNRVTRFFEEHGIFMTLFSVLPISIYNQGSPRYFMKTTWSDFFHKDLQDIGMQEVYNGELFFEGKSQSDLGTFGYQDRYDEYRRGRSSISGDFHDSMDFWHLARKFTASPVLNDDFIKCKPSRRIFADTTSDPLWVMARHNIVAKRPISKRANTKLK